MRSSRSHRDPIGHERAKSDRRALLPHVRERLRAQLAVRRRVVPGRASASPGRAWLGRWSELSILLGSGQTAEHSVIDAAKKPRADSAISGWPVVTTSSPGRTPPVYAYTWMVAASESRAMTSPGSFRAPTSTRSSIPVSRPTTSRTGQLTRRTRPAVIARVLQLAVEPQSHDRQGQEACSPRTCCQHAHLTPPKSGGSAFVSASAPSWDLAACETPSSSSPVRGSSRSSKDRHVGTQSKLVDESSPGGEPHFARAPVRSRSPPEPFARGDTRTLEPTLLDQLTSRGLRFGEAALARLIDLREPLFPPRPLPQLAEQFGADRDSCGQSRHEHVSAVERIGKHLQRLDGQQHEFDVAADPEPRFTYLVGIRRMSRSTPASAYPASFMRSPIATIALTLCR